MFLVEYGVGCGSVDVSVHRIPGVVNVDFDVFAAVPPVGAAAAAAAAATAATTGATGATGAAAVVVIIVGAVVGHRLGIGTVRRPCCRRAGCCRRPRTRRAADNVHGCAGTVPDAQSCDPRWQFGLSAACEI